MQAQPIEHQTEKNRLVEDVWDAILNDKWMWVVTWGKPRCGKTTLKMKLAFEVYKDWDKVLRAFIFNLSGLLYKLDSGEPERIYTRNMLHNRIPLLIYDDFGAHSNKAATQYDTSWDMFKGGFDVLATKVSVLIASMVDPTEPTFQIAQKYTHELYVFEGRNEERVYKYDEVNWQQDFKGWKARKRKSWIETNTFSEVPLDVYKQYDEMRMSLVDEVQQRIKDAMGDSLIEGILKRITPEDIGLLKILKEKGSVTREHLRDHLFEDADHKYKESLIRCKARSLALPIRHEGVTTYRYDITDLGLQVLDAVANKDAGKASQKT